MAASDLTGGNVMDVSASLMNDTAKTNYTYAAQSPYLRLALQELRELFELHSVSVTQKVTSPIIQVDAGQTQIVYNGVGVPALPNDFTEPLQVWESPRGLNQWTPLTRRDFLPHYMEGTQTSSFGLFSWNNNRIEFLPANANNDIKIDYIQQLFPDAGATVDENTQINVVNCQTFLEYRTASLCAEFIERNKLSSDALNAYASLALDRATGISAKSKQTIMTRRRPFRSGYKRRYIG
jgi:hypothetical protein